MNSTTCSPVAGKNLEGLKLLAVVVGLCALSFSPPDSGAAGQGTSGPNGAPAEPATGQGSQPLAVWAVVGVAIIALALGGLLLVRRQRRQRGDAA